MLSILSVLTNAEEPGNPFIDELIAAKAGGYWYNFKLNDSDAGRRLLGAPPEEQRAFVLAAAAWHDRHCGMTSYEAQWVVRIAMLTLLRRRLPLGHDDVATLLDWSRRRDNNYARGLPQMIKVVEDYLKGGEMTLVLRRTLEGLVGIVESQHCDAETRRWAVRLGELTGQTGARLPLVDGEAWADAAIEAIACAAGPGRDGWLELLNACAKASGSAPSAKW